MDAMKDGLAVLAGFIGLLTTVLTLYAKYLDVKKSAAVEIKTSSVTPSAAVISDPTAKVATPEPANDPYFLYRPPGSSPVLPLVIDAETIYRVRGMLRGPAVTMIVVGSLSLFANIGIAIFGFVDEFVAPITTETAVKQARLAAIQRGELKLPPGMMGPTEDRSERLTAGLTMVLLLGLSLPSAVGIWGGINMLRLKGYWISVVGSFGIMAGASLACCMSGAPIGGWSLWALFRPEVAASFR